MWNADKCAEPGWVQQDGFSELMETFGSVAEAFKQRRGAGDFGRMFLCVDCGHYVTTPIVRFFRMNPDTLRCYEHQRSNRLGAGKVQS